MSPCGVFEVDLFIKGKKFTQPVNVIQELNKNIISIDFIHTHKLTYDIIFCQVKFAGSGTNLLLLSRTAGYDLLHCQSKIQR